MFFSPLEQFDTINLISLSFFNLDISFNSVLLPLFMLIFSWV